MADRNYKCKDCDTVYKFEEKSICKNCNATNVVKTTYKNGISTRVCLMCNCSDFELVTPKCTNCNSGNYDSIITASNVSNKHTYEDPSHYKYWRAGKSTVEQSIIIAGEKEPY